MPISFTSEAKSAFCDIKRTLAHTTYLAHPCADADLSLHADASNVALGAILEQTVPGKTEVLGYFSKTLNDTQRRYSTYDLELLAMHSAVKYFEYMLRDKSFTIFTDNKSLVNTFLKPSANHTSKQVRQLSYLSQFDCQVLHKPSIDNKAADCLSRLAVHHIFEKDDIPVTISGIVAAQQLHVSSDAFSFPINSSIQIEQMIAPNCNLPVLVDTSLSKPRILLPPNLEQKIIKHYHNLSHPGIKSTQKLIQSRFVFKDMLSKVRDFVRCCVNCQRAKVIRHTVSPISSISMPIERFHRINIDIAGAFPSSRSQTFVFMCIDPFTRWIEAFPMPDQTTSSVVFSLNLHVQSYGAPVEIHSDSGCQFTSHTFNEYCQFLGVTHRLSSIRYPASNGLAERAIKSVKVALTAKLDSSNWVFHLPFIVLSLNTMFKSDLHGSPVELLYGQCLRLPGDFFLSSTTYHDSSHELICDMKKFARSLKPSCTRVTQGSTVHVPDTLNTCTSIFIRESSIKSNLSPPYSGPYPVISRNNKVFTVLKNDKAIKVAINNVKPGFVLEDFDIVSSSPSSDQSHSSATLLNSLHPDDLPPIFPQPRPRRRMVLPFKLQDFDLTS